MDLRANTAVDVLIGPFVANDDGDTVDDGLTILRADVLLSQNGQALTQKTNTSNAGNDSLGYYNCPLHIDDTDEEGNLVLVVHMTGTLPVRHEYNVLSEAAWDSLYAPKDTGFMDINVESWQETTVTLGNGRPDVNVDAIDDVSVSTIATAGKLFVLDDAGNSIPTVAQNQSGLAPAGEYDTELDANVSTRAPASEYDTQMARITANVATETKQDAAIVTLGTPVDLGDGAFLAEMITAVAGKTADAGSFNRATDSNEAIKDTGGGGGDATEAKQDTIIAAIGTPVDIDSGGATLAGNLKRLADDNNGATFDAEIDSLAKLKVTPTDANVIQMNGVTGPVDALEDQYDGTGLTGDTYPANQAQLGQIALTGAAVSTPTDSAPNGWANTWGEETLDEDSTHALDGTYHDVEAENDTTEKIDGYYIFDIGGDGVPTAITWTGYLTTGGGAAKSIIVEAWNGSSWDQIGEIVSGTVNSVNTFTLFTTHVTSKKVWIRFSNGAVAYTATTTLKTDQIFVSYAVVSQTVGYANGAVWIDTEHGNSGVELYVNGTADNPVDTLASAITIAEALNIHRFEVTAESALQFIEDMTGWVFNGSNYTVDFNGQNSDSLLLKGATVSGELTSTGGGIGMIQCRLSTGCTIPAGGYQGCTLPGDITISGPFYIFDHCISAVAGTSTPSIDFVNENVSKSVNFRSYSGGIEVKNFGHGTATHTMSLEGDGQLVFNSSCSNADAGDIIAIRGNFTVTDNVGGGWGGTTSDDARYDKAQVLDAVVDDATRIDASSINAVEAKVDTLQTSVDDVPNTAEFEARSLVAADYTVVGDEVNLSDNAITAAKFDQDTAHPMANADGSDLTEVGGDGAQLTEAGGDGGHLVEAGGTGDQLTDLGGMSTGMKGEVNTQVVDVLKTDTISEQAVGIPPVTPTFEEAVMYLYMALTKKMDVDATLKEFYNDAGAVVWKKGLSDDGSNYVETKGQSG